MKPNFPMLATPSLDSKEFELIKKMTSLVTSFIIEGNPNSRCHDFGFEPIVDDPFWCLNISNDSIGMLELPEKERMKVWDEILKEVNVPVY